MYNYITLNNFVQHSKKFVIVSCILLKDKLSIVLSTALGLSVLLKLTEREKEKIKYSSKNELKQEILKRYPRTDRLNKTVNNSDTPYSYTQKTRRAPRFDNY